jgi:hypothetical protein
MSEDLINNRIGEINDDLADLNEWRDNVEARLARLEQQVIAGRAQTILDARTMPVSAEMSATGRSDNPQAVDSQTALINARSGLRQPNKPTVPGYGRPVR